MHDSLSEATLASLPFEPAVRLHLRGALAKPGLIVITSPAREFNPHLVRACLRERADISRVLYAIQPPPHAELEGCLYMAPDPTIGFHRWQALKAAIECRPDLVAIDQINDSTTAELLAVGAQTRAAVGCLFFTDAGKALDSLLELGVPRKALTEIELTVIAGLSAPQLCAECREPTEAPDALWAFEGPAWKRGEGCDACADTGCNGQLLRFELLHHPKGSLLTAGPTKVLRDLARELASSGAAAAADLGPWLR